MDEQTVRAKILTLSSDILSGKAKPADIEKVTKLAKEYGLLPVLKAAFSEIHTALSS